MSKADTRIKTTGVIDIGSNSVRLMVARVNGESIETVYQNIITSRLLSGFSNGVLSKQSIDRTVEAITTFIKMAASLGVAKDDIYAFGTCAMREGKNSQEIIDCIRREEGVYLEVLSGPDEARIAYIGVSASGRNGIIDIGGGSTELTVGTDNRVLSCASCPIGAVRLYETAPQKNPDELVKIARDIVYNAWMNIEKEPVDKWTGVGGTITSLAAMSLKLREYSADAVTGYRLSRAKTEDWLYRLCDMPLDKRATIPGLKANRADIIPYGAAILVSFFELSKVREISVTENDNMLGFLKYKLGLD